MGTIDTAHEIEKKVNVYIHEKTKDHSTFNPLDVTFEGIAKSLELTDEEVSEALGTLSGSGDFSDSKRIQRIKCIKLSTDIWIPASKEGMKLRETLFNKEQAIEITLSNVYTSILFGIAFYFLVTKGTLETTTTDGIFLLSATVMIISIALGRFIQKKSFKFSYLIKTRVNHYKLWSYLIVSSVILFILTIIFDWSKYILLISAFATIISFGITIYQISSPKIES
jgi:hypothetical protein